MFQSNSKCQRPKDYLKKSKIFFSVRSFLQKPNTFRSSDTYEAKSSAGKQMKWKILSIFERFTWPEISLGLMPSFVCVCACGDPCNFRSTVFSHYMPMALCRLARLTCRVYSNRMRVKFVLRSAMETWNAMHSTPSFIVHIERDE